MTAVLLAVCLLSAPAPQGGGAPQAGGAGNAAAPDAPPQSIERLPEPQQLSYALGVNIGRSLLADGLDPDPQLFLDGLRDSLTDQPTRLSDERIAALLSAAAEKVRRAEAAAAQKRAAASRAALEAFLKKDGVEQRSTGEGVQFEKTGDGPKPEPDSVLLLHYESAIAGDAEPFFTTRQPQDFGRKAKEVRPATIALKELLPGLRAVLLDVPAGSKVTIGLPPDRAYGPAGGPGVPPNAALIVTVELLEVLPAQAEAGEDNEAGSGDAAAAGGTP
ncbi:FKBP-type peptidyl-prolyl cis-trans isomerase N-terminal domain-containing protein [Alienimonas californiensis]|uniref:Peptidyl-prolyl cis-trans isomerase n=1 Tax=Alienimonas californiensis TaxID=2527989 RepID=A0A517P4M6_9PLAN|nr:FKBP-type peptidyl-prolyl cis-trans isomerase N-terminal domain-containing protein [Alienimonas californiensis]QDT14305.1 FKBP-type peptidyl-prolyl cis-trans isomerase FkpA precursor [Alienimonas californiensis]